MNKNKNNASADSRIKNDKKYVSKVIIVLISILVLTSIAAIAFIDPRARLKNYERYMTEEQKADDKKRRNFSKYKEKLNDIYKGMEEILKVSDDDFLMQNGELYALARKYIKVFVDTTNQKALIERKIDLNTGNKYYKILWSVRSEVSFYPDYSFKSYKVNDYAENFKFDEKHPNKKFDSKENYIKRLGYKENYKLTEVINLNKLKKYVYIPYEKNNSYVPERIEFVTSSNNNVYEVNVIKSKVDEYAKESIDDKKLIKEGLEEQINKKEAEKNAVKHFGGYNAKVISSNLAFEKTNRSYNIIVLKESKNYNKSEDALKKIKNRNGLEKVWNITVLVKESNGTNKFYDLSADYKTGKVLEIK